MLRHSLTTRIYSTGMWPACCQRTHQCQMHIASGGPVRTLFSTWLTRTFTDTGSESLATFLGTAAWTSQSCHTWTTTEPTSLTVLSSATATLLPNLSDPQFVFVLLFKTHFIITSFEIQTQFKETLLLRKASISNLYGYEFVFNIRQVLC
jgi:hypothetical protein